MHLAIILWLLKVNPTNVLIQVQWDRYEGPPHYHLPTNNVRQCRALAGLYRYCLQSLSVWKLMRLNVQLFLANQVQLIDSGRASHYSIRGSSLHAIYTPSELLCKPSYYCCILFSRWYHPAPLLRLGRESWPRSADCGIRFDRWETEMLCCYSN